MNTCPPHRTAASLSLLALLLAPAWGSDADGLKPGDVLGAHNWQKAEGLLPPEILRHYERGEYSNQVVAWEPGALQFGERFLAHTWENEKWLDVDDHGTLLDRRTGKRPDYLYGLPFPRIDAADPRAAVKILWNHFFQRWCNGNFHMSVQLNWLNPRGLDRSAIQEVYFLYYTGQPEEYIPPANPNGLYVQFLATTVSPTDLAGTASLSWRYQDAAKRDSVWVFVPALRRVRAVSPANRSDGFLGSDLSQDDGPLFDGKPEDFTWKLVGESEILRLLDPFSYRREPRVIGLPGGGVRIDFAKMPMVGFQEPRWKGSPWAPVNMYLAKRTCWVVEAVPKDRYYLYGKLVLYIDKETFQGAYNRKFDWKGELVNTYAVFGGTNWGEWCDELTGTGTFYQGAENIRVGRATVTTIPQDLPNPPADWRIPLDPAFFDNQTLVRFGK